MEIDIDVILEDLKEGKTNKTRQSLDKLNETLREYHGRGERDFSITTIGRVSGEDGGVGYESIRATANKHYRDLIEAWAAKAKTTTKKPLSSHSRSRRVPQDNQLLERISDPALRVLFGQIIAERNRYRTQLNILKSQAEVVIDKRPVRQFEASAKPSVELLPSLKGIISDNELKALRFAASDECIERQGWLVTQAGQVKNELREEVFPRGFMTGLRKLVGEVEVDD
ncbi:gamma-mobile-trio protein GmtX [Halomonas rhizosphaerae]|uniref:Gamma-mobile-trio protein GmtX n=1 Tax=Halomonas rhizosphaerae TaxID=3043296 RepID=A0ABT6UYU8_9GAMM|nr:gamma-mobile-trio protein GmtX [Halomonas rhizosphaerae]MDI5891111.1 gamma-mobile-trio protein GmtX [Halomonas rhizosphaerae]